MSSNGTPTPDLATILKTLAGLAPQNQVQQAQPASQAPPLPVPEAFPAQQVWQQSISQATQSSRPNAAAAPFVSAKNVNVVDPSTIIEWSAGLRCVMRQVAKHEGILQDVRRVSIFVCEE